jgi:VanZ family protein
MASSDWYGYRVAAWAGQAALLAAIILVLVQGQWIPAAALSGFLICSFLFVAFEHKLPRLFDLLFVIAALINAAGWAWNLYNQPGLYDEIAHFYTMFAITLAAGYMLFNELMRGFKGHRLLFLVIVTSLGIAIGALWEVAEWLADFVVARQIISGLDDTITDIILDSAGALLAAFANLWGLNEQQQPVHRPSQPTVIRAASDKL